MVHPVVEGTKDRYIIRVSKFKIISDIQKTKQKFCIQTCFIYCSRRSSKCTYSTRVPLPFLLLHSHYSKYVQYRCLPPLPRFCHHLHHQNCGVQKNSFECLCQPLRAILSMDTNSESECGFDGGSCSLTVASILKSVSAPVV